MKQIFYFIISCILLLCTEKAYNQEGDWKVGGLRIGADLSKFVLPLFFPETKGYEFLADIQILDKIFIAGEYGRSRTELGTDSYNFSYELKGSYFKLGLNKNILKPDEITRNDIVFFGARYSFSALRHKAADISITDEHWEEVSGIETEEISLKCHFIDLTAGVKTELFKNIYMGWTIRGMIRLYLKSNNIMDPYFIPGFGKGGKKASVGFNYSVYYRIPYKITAKEER
ncbi:MAG: hypothetical protein JSV22_14625 [Bacteroidales bacterium]|nr:MAG: hypothetical protein JSV22_14625 [Bacteroidales bacterium]